MIKNILRFGAIVIAFALLFSGLFLVYSTITFYNPDKEILLQSSASPDTVKVNTAYSLITWNIGYAGLGDNMDFFYDGGKQTRDTKARTLENLDSIKKFLTQNRTDFIILQEVDFESRRSYNFNQVQAIGQTLNYFTFYATNYQVSFVPVPLNNPMGRVNSGIMTLSRYTPQNAKRIQLPGLSPWPNRIFNLRRCLLITRFPTNNGREFVLINTHNSAFENDSLKMAEMNFIRELALNEYERGNYVIVGGDWNQLPPNFAPDTFGNAYETKAFKPMSIDSGFMPTGWQWAFDPTFPTNRYLDRPYSKNCRTIILDFFLLSPNIQVAGISTINLNFRYSDHNPVKLTFTFGSKP
ncbi:MAG: endonuclease/exonuclease/phosphatase family protein [Bacteroidota bacterium]